MYRRNLGSWGRDKDMVGEGGGRVIWDAVPEHKLPVLRTVRLDCVCIGDWLVSSFANYIHASIILGVYLRNTVSYLNYHGC